MGRWTGRGVTVVRIGGTTTPGVAATVGADVGAALGVGVGRGWLWVPDDGRLNFSSPGVMIVGVRAGAGVGVGVACWACAAGATRVAAALNRAIRWR
jgi:hypothetical protein